MLDCPTQKRRMSEKRPPHPKPHARTAAASGSAPAGTWDSRIPLARLGPDASPGSGGNGGNSTLPAEAAGGPARLCDDACSVATKSNAHSISRHRFDSMYLLQPALRVDRTPRNVSATEFFQRFAPFGAIVIFPGDRPSHLAELSESPSRFSLIESAQAAALHFSEEI